ncbi:cysteine desulfurase-like protein [uncultured Friedmanniella sp.]|uniref:cysteine desulfurase-like protein n=1 Tax=uncultured Friedmanniella sp. TaxID=335381 RepID=UPI0035CA44B1
MSFDPVQFRPAQIRPDFPALAAGLAHFDSPGGTQTPTPVIEAISRALAEPLANRGHGNQAQRNAETIVVEARAAVADLVAGRPEGVVFGRSATSLTFDFARTLAATWSPGDEVVVSRLDHDANIRPWVLAAEERGAVVRWVDFDPTTAELDPARVADVLTDRTRLVALTAASNLLGTKPDVAAVAAAVHTAGALFWVDGVHYAAHAVVDLAALGCDFFVCSPYKFCGPHHGILVADPALLATLHPAKLLPSADVVPERFELGTLPYELLAGATAAVDYLAQLAPSGESRREHLQASLAAVEQQEDRLTGRLEQALADLGATVYSRARHRTSTLLFDLPGTPAAVVAERLAAVGVNAPAGHFYAIEASRHLGLGDRGAVRVGLAPYTDDDDVDRLVAGLSALS